MADVIQLLSAGVVDALGDPLSSGTVTFYASGSTDLATAYSDSDLTVPLSNPATLDAAGRLEAYTDIRLRLYIEDSTGAEIWDIDDATARGSLLASDITLDASGSAPDFTTNTVDAALQAIKDSLGGNNAYYLNSGASAVERTIQSKLSEVFSVKDFGAVGDGVTDDSTAVQAAATAVVTNAGGNLYFPAGTYLLSATISCLIGSLKISGEFAQINFTNNGICLSLGGASNAAVKSNIIVEGISMTATSIGTGGQQCIQVNHARNVHVMRCRFTDPGGNGIKLNDNCTDCVVSDCYADNAGVVGIFSEGDGTVDGANMRIKFVNNEVTNVNYGIEAKETTDVQIIGNHVHTGQGGTTKWGIVVARDNSSGAQEAPQRVIVANNIVEGLDNEGIECSQTADFIIANNVVSNCTATAITGSGSNGIIANNIVLACGAGISANYNSSVIGGAGAATGSDFDTARMHVEGNRVEASDAGESYSFNICDDSIILNNTCIDQSFAGFCFHLTDCDDTRFEGNRVMGAAGYTFAYRVETSSANTTMKSNNGVAGSSGVWSIPGEFAGHIVDKGPYVEKHVARVQTTDTTNTTIFTYTVPSNHYTVLEAWIVAKSSSGSTVQFSQKSFAQVLRQGGSAAVNATGDIVTADETDAGTTAAFVASSNDVILRVNGIAASDIDWLAYITIIRSALE